MSNYNYLSFTSIKEDGQMSSAASFYPEEMSKEERILQMQKNKQKVGDRLGFNYKKLFIPIQKNSKKADLYEDGHTLVLDSELVESYDDLYDFDYNCDIVKITSGVKNVAIGYPIADCALITAVNLQTQEAVMAHCGGEYINRYLPMTLIDKLGGNEDDIRVHVSPFAHNLVYSSGMPTWISNERVWANYLKETEDGLNIDQLNALKNMLLERQIQESQIYFYPFSTTDENEFYSNSRAFNGAKEDSGRFISGVVYTDREENGPYSKMFR